jgi:capsular polysaccharide biosynthesis protein
MMLEIDFKQYMQVIKRRFWLIFTIMLITCTTTGIVSYYFVKPVYSASTKLIVNKSDSQQGSERLEVNAIQANMLIINTYKEIIRTPAIMSKVVTLYPELNVTMEELVRTIQVSSIPETQIMTITMRDNSYERAVKIVNAVAEVFKSANVMNVDNVTILDEAKIADNLPPVLPNPPMNLIIAFVVSLFLSVTITFILEYFDDSIRNEQDITTHLGIPVLSSISIIKSSDLKADAKSKSSKKVAGETVYAGVNR